MMERDQILSRIVDRLDQPADWDRLEAMSAAAGDTTAEGTTAELVAALRSDCELRALLAEPMAIADAVEIPSHALGFPSRLRGAWPHLLSSSGWAAAVLILCCWIWLKPDVPVGSEPQQTVAETRARGAEFVRELPNLFVEARPMPDSSDMEVVYVRRTMERAVVSRATSVGLDESGQPFEARVDLTRYAPKSHY